MKLTTNRNQSDMHQLIRSEMIMEEILENISL